MNQMSELHAVTTMTPLRVSFMGGGTDLLAYYSLRGGVVVSAAIRAYIYVSVKRHSALFGERYRVSYSETEHQSSRQDIRNDIVRATLEFLDFDEPLHISTSADLPAMSGLGSSSSFAVGLLHALHALRGEEVSSSRLAQEACQVEIELLGRPIGKQDQYAAAIGGVNAFYFEPDGRVRIEPVNHHLIEGGGLDHLYLVWTGMQRRAEEILQRQNEDTQANLESLDLLREQAMSLLDDVSRGELTLEQMAKYLSYGWELKRGLAKGIGTSELDAIWEDLLDSGAQGGKLLGAGGGGFFLVAVPPENVDSFLVRQSSRYPILKRIDVMGSRVLSMVRDV